MPVASSEPSVALSFANNFWGKEDAGVGPMLQRMHDAKTTCEELKAFYTARGAIEDEFARKLLALSKKPLGSAEFGSLKSSLDVLRLEVESMAKAHQNIANQMKTELDEPLTAFSGAMRERRKIIQGGTEKLLKLKMQQTQTVNKTRDRYEQDCLKIKGYLAQGHMVMGQEERKNKARLEKAQMGLTNSNAEYDTAIKALEKTTERWNRDWKAACDKFQDLEEERIDFLKSSCWTFANISSTVCVSDDASCEKIRLSLEDCEVEKDIISFISERGTGQEIPDAPKYINFCRGDYSDDGSSEVVEETNYSLAQFPRAGNPTYRSSSPNPSTASSQAAEPRSRGRPSIELEPEQAIQKRDNGRREKERGRDRQGRRREAIETETPPGSSSARRDQQPTPSRAQRPDRNTIQNTPHNEYPLDGMTMYCRPGNMVSDGSLSNSPVQTPSSSHGGSDYSNLTSESSSSEVSQQALPVAKEDDRQMKRRNGFFSGGGPFRRKSKSEKEHRNLQNQQQQQLALQEKQRRTEVQRRREQTAPPALDNRKTWSPNAAQTSMTVANTQANSGYGSSGGRQRQSQFIISNERSASPDNIDPTASLALNVGGNVFDVSTPQESPAKMTQKPQEEEMSMDPIAQALEELKGVTKNTVGRSSADRFFGLATPAPTATPGPGSGGPAANQRGTPLPTYLPKTTALDVPPPAFDSAQMQQTTQRYINQRNNLLEGPPQMPALSNEASSMRQRANTIDYQRPQSRQNSQDMVVTREGQTRTTSPGPTRSVSPRPQLFGDEAYRGGSPKPQNAYSRATSPNPYTQSRPGTANSGRPGQYAAYNRGSPAPTSQEVALRRAASPVPSHHSRNESYNSRSRSRADSAREGYGSANNRQSFYGDQGSAVQMYQGGGGQVGRPRSKSVAEPNRSRDGRPIINYARAMYQYTAAIPEEMSFAKGDILAILAHQEDGWWEAELVGVQGRPGLVPSNYLQVC